MHIPVLRSNYLGTAHDLTLVIAGRFVTGEQVYALNQEGERFATLNVNLAGNPASEACFWIRDYSESEGLPDALVKAGVIHLTGRTTRVGFGRAREAFLTNEAKVSLGI